VKGNLSTEGPISGEKKRKGSYDVEGAVPSYREGKDTKEIGRHRSRTDEENFERTTDSGPLKKKKDEAEKTLMGMRCLRRGGRFP